MNWKETKKIISSKITNLLTDFQFNIDKSEFVWFRYINDVCQMIKLEKMSGNHLKTFAFVVNSKNEYIGGNLKKYTIDGSINYDGQNFWSVEDSSLDNSLLEIMNMINEIAIPWFSTVTSSQLILKIIECYSVTPLNFIKKKYSFDSDFKKVKIDSFDFFSKTTLNNMLNELLLSKLNILGFKKTDYDFIYLRKRNEVFDVIEILPINFGTHLACNAYNWVKELSTEKNKKFNEDSRIIFVGGQIDKDGLANEEPKIYVLKNKENARVVMDKICSNLIENTIPMLSSIKTKQGFVKSIDTIHDYSLKAFGLK